MKAAEERGKMHVWGSVPVETEGSNIVVFDCVYVA